jgi:hypothetical protein
MTDKPQLKAWTSPSLLVIDASSAQEGSLEHSDSLAGLANTAFPTLS